MEQTNGEKDLEKKCRDIEKKGIDSAHWPEILEIIKWLETKEYYERCQELWEYYKKITDT
jgi:hypothetical protein